MLLLVATVVVWKVLRKRTEWLPRVWSSVRFVFGLGDPKAQPCNFTSVKVFHRLKCPVLLRWGRWPGPAGRRAEGRLAPSPAQGREACRSVGGCVLMAPRTDAHGALPAPRGPRVTPARRRGHLGLVIPCVGGGGRPVHCRGSAASWLPSPSSCDTQRISILGPSHSGLATVVVDSPDFGTSCKCCHTVRRRQRLLLLSLISLP